MKIALFGYGKMGQAIEQIAVHKGFAVVAVLRASGPASGNLNQADVAIDFTQPDAVVANAQRAGAAGIPLVIGTTGWYDRLDQVRQAALEARVGVVYAPNFSLGVNLMLHTVRAAARLFGPFDSYAPFMTEAHHRFKLDAPSGTALALKNILAQNGFPVVPLTSLRAGSFPGTHTVGFDGEADTLTITHTARNRSGFAEGALFAAEWIRGRTGFHDFETLIDHKLKIAAENEEQRRQA